jgi:hypothetical protein
MTSPKLGGAVIRDFTSNDPFSASRLS